MKRIVLQLLALTILSCLALPTPARAVLISVNFTVTGGATGTFSFDSSLIPVGGGTIANTTTGLGLSSLSFTTQGVLFTTANADASRMTFDSGGTLTSWEIDGKVNGLATFSTGTNDLILATNGPFQFVPPSGTAESITSWSVATTPSAPEPATVSLLGLGLLPLGWIRRRRK